MPSRIRILIGNPRVLPDCWAKGATSLQGLMNDVQYIPLDAPRYRGGKSGESSVYFPEIRMSDNFYYARYRRYTFLCLSKFRVGRRFRVPASRNLLQFAHSL